MTLPPPRKSDSQTSRARSAVAQVSVGGSLPGMRGQPAFVLHRRSPAPIPVLIAVPHAGRIYPSDLLARMRNPAIASVRLEDRLIDLVAEQVALETGADLLVARAPRAMIDLNRATDDIDWDMVAGGPPTLEWATLPRFAAGRRSRSGLGLVPRRLSGMGELWRQRLTPADLAARIDEVHRPYHSELEASLERLRDRWGAALLIDLHSMPPLGPKEGAGRAVDFVIGDRFGASCDGMLVQSALSHLSVGRWLASHNRPYAGGYVLDRHGAPARGIHAMQVEVCRQVYLEETMHEPGPGLGEVVSTLVGLVRLLADEVSLRSGNGHALAAE
ncbi:N-formylglutamate amidohydrolase [Aurantiacibacter xanthus]|uniref:N-formylglutamate amidohydrolase n=1 Tax=Aurantiacibacter xanthus TaxID=1784712 RepID=A0A3A1P9R3_9SPHN|nr:N-formylglutamate amidohydrolase [Aurantiacibacter xanthus]RIV88693.1 N-formylglutamate amidohydrolase [Aurantiacibacter xanthus]